MLSGHCILETVPGNLPKCTKFAEVHDKLFSLQTCSCAFEWLSFFSSPHGAVFFFLVIIMIGGEQHSRLRPHSSVVSAAQWSGVHRQFQSFAEPRCRAFLRPGHFATCLASGKFVEIALIVRFCVYSLLSDLHSHLILCTKRSRHARSLF